MTDDPFRSPAPWRHQFDHARDPYAARNSLGAVDAKYVADAIAAGGGGGGGGAPTSAQYITAAADATLTAERVLTNTATVTWDFATPGQAKANAATGGGGNVSNSGTPTSGQYAKWVTATTIQGVAPATVLSDIGAQPAGSYLTTAAAAATYQPLDADLTAIAALTGTNVIYYRSAANTWSPVTIGANLTFSGGTLAATGGGAPVGAEYITSTTDATLTAERVLTDTATVTWDRTTAGQIKATAIAAAPAQAGFSAHKNGVAQGGMTGAAYNKVTLTNESYDQGSYYDAANSRWTPPSGIVHLDAAATFSTSLASGFSNLAVYKNGAVLKIASNISPSDSGSCQISVDDLANGTDYYELFCSVQSSTTATVNGAATSTYFSGHRC